VAYALYMETEGMTADGALESELVNRVTWKHPNPLALVGSRAGDERNGFPSILARAPKVSGNRRVPYERSSPIPPTLPALLIAWLYWSRH